MTLKNSQKHGRLSLTCVMSSYEARLEPRCRSTAAGRFSPYVGREGVSLVFRCRVEDVVLLRCKNLGHARVAPAAFWPAGYLIANLEELDLWFVKLPAISVIVSRVYRRGL